MLGVYISVFTNSLMFTIVFPIASKMIMYFGLVEKRTETGYWVGLLAGSIMLGRFLSSPVWGILCDKWGRRPVMLLGIVSTSVLAVLYGMSINIVWALIIRFLQGLFSPITIVTRTIIGEVYSGKDQAKGMSNFILVGNLGYISGNILGGFFEDPSKSGISQIELFTKFPFLLPNLFTAVAGMIGFPLCYFFLSETKSQTSLIDHGEPRNYLELMKDPLVFQVIFMYCTCSFIGTGFSELMVLLIWADKSDGGFELGPDEIGVITASTSVLMVFYIRWFYAKYTEKLGVTTGIKLSLLIFVPVMFGFPIISLFRYENVLKWISLIVSCLACYTLDFISIASSLVMLNNTVYSHERGKIHGISMSLGNLSRGFSPPILGITFASTAGSGRPYPLNFAFSFILLAIFIFIVYIIARRLNKSLDHSKGETTEEKIQEEVSEMMSMSVAEENELT